MMGNNGPDIYLWKASSSPNFVKVGQVKKGLNLSDHSDDEPSNKNTASGALGSYASDLNSSVQPNKEPVASWQTSIQLANEANPRPMIPTPGQWSRPVGFIGRFE